MLPPESKRVHFCLFVSTLQAQSLLLTEQSVNCESAFGFLVELADSNGWSIAHDLAYKDPHMRNWSFASIGFVSEN